MNNDFDNQDIDLNKYSKAKSGSLSKAGVGLWMLEHKRHLILGIIVILGGVSLFLYSYFFYNLFDYLRYGDEQQKNLNELSTANLGAGTIKVATPLETLEEKMFYHGDSYDFLAKVKNPNDNFFANVSYCFVDADVDLACGSTIIFPGEEKYLLIVSEKLEKKPGEQKFKIKSNRWERVDIRKYPNWKDYYSLRADFTIANIKFDKTVSMDGSYRNFDNLNFDIRNNSPYNYWEVPLSILMFSKGNIVGVNTYRALEFKSGENRQIKITWPNSASSVDDVKVFLNLNVLDELNYMSYKL
ncbi:hypothetical protein CVU82_02635 [Candidatus Falkowbacteria bacterium HGW-Falkowbacteria-1]|uniref:Uncharacterized protein n=1 Tax=Candidatus Falkowbacteria bacterium HGW-Falkowbacteria-1 TaxID=2013768 RepID=A0A2N2E9U9_9BACT|nr:MAG: hypothetical protein CVU82_02635 [Candidatus Falkowbacteria bacterium HGW-Falkowbacteria-1]